MLVLLAGKRKGKCLYRFPGVYPVNKLGEVFLILAHLSRILKGELIVYRGILRPSVVRPSFVRRQHLFIEQSSTFHMTFVQIGGFDWLSGGKP